jgi:hypothetical protein
MWQLVTRGRLRCTSHDSIHAAEERLAVAYVGIDGDKKQREMYRSPATTPPHAAAGCDSQT